MASRPKVPVSPRLVVIEGPEKGRIVPLRPGTLVVGRSKGDVIIQDPRISRSHVALHVDEATGKVTFTDLKSLNGVQLNGDNLDSGELKDGDRLQLGNTTFDCQTGAQEESSTEPAIAMTKRRKPLEDPERSEDTHVSSVNVLQDLNGELKPEPTAIGEPVFPVEEKVPENKVIGFYRRLSPRARLYGSAAAILLLTVILFFPGSKKAGNLGSPVERDFASIRKLEAEGKLTEAAARAEKIKTDIPTNPEVHRILGDLYLKQRAFAQSIESYKKAYDLDPKQIELLPTLARLYLDTDQMEPARSVNAEIDHFLSKGTGSREFFISVANLYLDQPKLDVKPEKMVIIGQAMQNKFATDDSAGFRLEAMGHIDQGQPEEAMKVLEKAQTLFPKDESVYLYLFLGKFKLGDQKGIETVIQQWRGLFPRSIQPLVFMGQIKYRVKENDEALKYLQEAIQLGSANPSDPLYPKAMFLLGEVYYQQNQMVEAENALRQSCELGFSDGCEHVLVKGPPPQQNPLQTQTPSPRTPQSQQPSRVPQSKRK